MKKTILSSLLILSTISLAAEEGMWTFNAIPVQKIKEKYGVELDEAWAQHVQKSCLRVSLGGSASFVSPQGLVLTNHHVGSKAIYHLSTEKDDLLTNGFLAKSLDQEIQCPNMYVDQLISIRDVTAEVNQSGTDAMSAAERESARKSSIANIKQQAQKSTGLQPEVVSLYQGARYYLYLYERYSDVRLVMAPEKSAAFFGGDTDNFEYPRYNLDICFFRVYKDGKPLTTPNYLKWSEAGPKPFEALFVAGHPGKTNRMLTSAHLQFLKEQEILLLKNWLQERKRDLQSFARQSAENKRIAAQDLFSIGNSLKVMNNLYQELERSSIIQDKEKEEKKLYKLTENEPWVKLQTALEQAKPYYSHYLVLEGIGANYSKLYMWAKRLVRLSAEVSKPNESRLKEYVDSELQTLELDFFSEEPVYKSLDKVQLMGSFKRAIKVLGEGHPVSKILLAGKPLEKRVDALLAGTQLHRLEYRKQLYADLKQVQTSSDPLILLARELDPYARSIRQKKEDEFDSVCNESYTGIAKILFDKYGESVYPDATFTLRLSFGSMQGYSENSKHVDPMTTLGGTFDHAKSHSLQEPYNLPKTWLAKEPLLKKNTPFNFISTNDLIGGNSGSPVINQKGEFVGIIFDGNSQSIVWNFGFNDTQGRAISVHSEGIIEALKSIYGAEALVQELRGEKLQ